MECRKDCGACCIAPSIERSFYGMPGGKPAGTRCVHLSPVMSCTLFGDARRPALCDAFAPELAVCGDTREQALLLLSEWEQRSLPDSAVTGVGW